MMRLLMLVEGQTEDEFVRGVLAPHLLARGISLAVVIVTTSRDAHGRKRRGGGTWSKWRRDLSRWRLEHPGSDVRFTTLFDLYGLPDDFPELAASSKEPDTRKRAALLEQAMVDAIGEWRLIPYVQRHEFEALVLAGLDRLADLLDDPADVPGVASLRKELADAPPEDVDDGPTTAPSKRLEAHIPGYRKTLHGPLVGQDVGLATLRQACPRFDAWVSRLEALGSGHGAGL